MKNNYIFTFASIAIFSLLFCSKVVSKQVDTLIFNSTYEQKAFINYINGNKVEPIKFLLSINYTDNSERVVESLNTFLNSLEKNGIRTLPLKKKIKEIYKKVNQTFLKKYSEDVYFTDIFNNGDYNYITASALFALALDYFNIEYSIKKTPEYIYLVADPNGEPFDIKTPLQSNGFMYYDDQYKKNYIDYLRENKLITEDEYKSSTISVLFEKQFNKTTSINLYQLAALQYYKSGVSLAISSDFMETIRNLEKAELLYQDYSIKFLKNNALINILSYQNNSKNYSGKILAKYINSNLQNTASIEYATNYFKVVANELVINHPNVAAYKIFYSEFSSAISESISKKDFDQTYNDILGFYYYTNSDYTKSLLYFGNSFKLNSENIATKQVIFELIGKYFSTLTNFEDAMDSVNVYVQRFPFLIANTNFQQILFGGYTTSIINYYEKGNLIKGSEVLLRFEKCVTENKLNDTYPEMVNVIYMQLSSYFYRMHYYENQEEILQRGLGILPNSRALQSSLKSFQSSKAELMEYAKKYHYETKIKPYTMDSESVMVIKEVANKNRNKINLNVDKYLKGRKWRLESIAVGDKIIQLDQKEQVTLTFENENLLRINDTTGESTGTWSYDKNNSTIKFQDNKDKATMNVLIFEIDDTTLKTIMFNDNDPKKIISILKSL
jgi:hypothetical protein